MWETGARVLLFIMGVCLIGYGAYLGSTESGTASAVVLNGTGIICLIFSYLSKFKKFKGFGIEGELWEERQHEAEELITSIKSEVDNLHAIVTTVAESSFTSIVSIGRMNPVPTSYKIDIIRRLEEDLKRIGVDETKVKESKQIMIGLITYDFASPIIKAIIERLRIVQSEKHKIVEAFEKPIKVDDKYNNAIENWRAVGTEIDELKKLTNKNTNPSEYLNKINEFLENTKYLDSKEILDIKSNLKEEFLDLEYYIQTNELRRPEQYATSK